MTRKAFLQKYFLRFAVSLTLLALIVYTLYHVFGGTSESLMKTPVRQYTDLQIVSGQSYLFRNESVLTVSEPGAINDLAESGSKISKGVALTEVWNGYDTTELDAVQKRLDAVNRMIGVLENSAVSADTTLSHADDYRQSADADYLAIRRAVLEGDFEVIADLEDDMLTQLNRYVSLTQSSDEIRETLQALKAERSALLRGTSTTVLNERASGYFYDRTYVDGYESIFTTETLAALTADGFDALKTAEPRTAEGEYAVGKMVYDFEWYIAMELDAAEAALVCEQTLYTVRFPENRGRELDMSCTMLIQRADGSAVAVFSSQEVQPDFSYLRTQTAEITVGSLDGYYVPESALHTVVTDTGNTVDGVYVFENSTVYFRRVEILRRGDGYCVVAEQNGREGYLALYDILVTSGKDLYDGRVYK